MDEYERLRLIAEEAAVAGDDGGGAEVEVLADGFRPTDVGNAERLIRSADGRLRFVHAWGKWLVYDEGRWIVDFGDALATEWAKQVARGLFRLVPEMEGDRDERKRLITWATRSEQASTIGHLLTLARGIDGVLVDHDDLDAQPALLNVLNGTVDLRTGELRPHDPDDLLTMQAPVIYDPAAAAPLWESCLRTWLPDEELREYVQCVSGSAATGFPIERLFVNVGQGANGKSKFFGTLHRVLGPFAVVPHKSLLVAERHEGHPTHVASLFRARMLIAPETASDDRLNEALVKNLTGGDPMRARRVREDEWSFEPSWTAFMHTNYRPRIDGTDEGIWRRVRLIPWDVTIPADERDEHLAERLIGEASGILNWIVAGAMQWLDDPCEQPPAVTIATDLYRTEEDHFGRFLGDEIVVGRGLSVRAGPLRLRYEKWCATDGVAPSSPQRVGHELRSRGYENVKVGVTKEWRGFTLRPEAP